MKRPPISLFVAMTAIALGVVVINAVPGNQKSLGIALIAVGGLLLILNINKLNTKK